MVATPEGGSEKIGFLMHTNIDDDLLTEAFAVTQAKTEKELIHLALQELIRSRKRKNLFDLAGQIDFHGDYNHKNLRQF